MTAKKSKFLFRFRVPSRQTTKEYFNHFSAIARCHTAATYGSGRLANIRLVNTGVEKQSIR
jgi:hypothetical protein